MSTDGLQPQVGTRPDCWKTQTGVGGASVHIRFPGKLKFKSWLLFSH